MSVQGNKLNEHKVSTCCFMAQCGMMRIRCMQEIGRELCFCWIALLHVFQIAGVAGAIRAYDIQAWQSFHMYERASS